MNIVQIILFCSIILFIIVLFWQNRKLYSLLEQNVKDESFSILGQWISDMKTGIHETNMSIQQQLYNSNKSLNSRLDSTTRLLQMLNKDLGHVHEIGSQMRDFQSLFRNPKFRGNVGENILKEMLYQVLPRDHISLQHKYKNGQIVDALVQIENRYLPIDAKFPLANYIKYQNASQHSEDLYKKEFFNDIKKHIRNVSTKYISPDDKTLDFALVYIPSEAIYYEIINYSQILDFAREQNILLISPNSFYYFLKIIMIGLEGQKIEEATVQIIKTFKALQKDAVQVNEDLRLLMSHLNNSKNAAERLYSDFALMSGKLENNLFN